MSMALAAPLSKLCHHMLGYSLQMLKLIFFGLQLTQPILKVISYIQNICLHLNIVETCPYVFKWFFGL